MRLCRQRHKCVTNQCPTQAVLSHFCTPFPERPTLPRPAIEERECSVGTTLQWLMAGTARPGPIQRGLYGMLSQVTSDLQAADDTQQQMLVPIHFLLHKWYGNADSVTADVRA
eukprot:GHUV01036985.1.p1 GENE.GHUV01036985.1~~GHUV01036985.1.p1  ORF type:complete len:113 (+),score=15.30 GHUV01036985.1:461-799(+)